jgi:hypothetical protein
MRTEIIDYVQGLNLGTFTVSTELPYTESGQALYIKNPKKIYVDEEQIESEPILETLNASNVINEQMSVTIYFSCDSKLLPANYDTVVTDLKAARNITTVENIFRRELDVSTGYDGDLLVTELVIRFNKIIT